VAVRRVGSASCGLLAIALTRAFGATSPTHARGDVKIFRRPSPTRFGVTFFDCFRPRLWGDISHAGDRKWRDQSTGATSTFA
jgi:hypothetical protein